MSGAKRAGGVGQATVKIETMRGSRLGMVTLFTASAAMSFLGVAIVGR